MDTSEIAATYAAEGPFATIYLDTTSAVEGAAEKLELRWKNALRELERNGVDEPTRDALTAARGGHGEGGTRVLVGARGRALLATSTPGPPAQETISVGPLPHLLPLLDRLALAVPHLVVLTDREGADILAFSDGDAQTPTETGTVTGTAPDIRKVAPGGWSQRRYQARAEEGWAHNAKDVAELVEKIARDVDPHVIVAAGDVRALGLLHEHLPERRKPLWKVVPGGRGEDGSTEALAGHVVEALGERVTSDTIDLLEDFAEERGQRDRASDGSAQTVTALRRAQVDVLLVSEELDDEQTAWFGPDPTALSLDPAELGGVDGGGPQEGPLVDVLLRAALGTGARVRVVPGGMEQSPTGGVGALLRYASGERQ